MGHWATRFTKLLIVVSQLDIEKKFKFQTLKAEVPLRIPLRKPLCLWRITCKNDINHIIVMTSIKQTRIWTLFPCYIVQYSLTALSKGSHRTFGKTIWHSIYKRKLQELYFDSFERSMLWENHSCFQDCCSIVVWERWFGKRL